MSGKGYPVLSLKSTHVFSFCLLFLEGVNGRAGNTIDAKWLSILGFHRMIRKSPGFLASLKNRFSADWREGLFSLAAERWVLVIL